jgi:transposase-like protein
MEYGGSQGDPPYPRSLGEFQSWFATDADCLDYLEWLRWPNGFVCPRCDNAGGWRVSDGSFKCTSCKAQTAVTAGTLFDRRRTPLTVWFQVCWEFATAKDGVSALAVKRTLQIGSYQTAWAMLHRLRAVLIRPGRELLSGQVEVDETYIGGEQAGLAGGRAKGKKALVAVAVEVKPAKGFGRCRMRVITDGSARTLQTFIIDNIAPGSVVITDGWNGYLGIDKVGYTHDRRSQRAAKALGEDIGTLLPGVHRIASLAKRWLLSTHQGAVRIEHLPGYLDEFCFRFNRRRSRSRGLVFYRVLQLAVGHDPVRYQQLITGSTPKTVRPSPPGNRGHPPSLDRPRAQRPWRDTPPRGQVGSDG